MSWMKDSDRCLDDTEKMTRWPRFFLTQKLALISWKKNWYSIGDVTGVSGWDRNIQDVVWDRNIQVCVFRISWVFFNLLHRLRHCSFPVSELFLTNPHLHDFCLSSAIQMQNTTFEFRQVFITLHTYLSSCVCNSSRLSQRCSSEHTLLSTFHLQEVSLKYPVDHRRTRISNLLTTT